MNHLPNIILCVVATLFWHLDRVRNACWPEIKRRHPTVYLRELGGRVLVLTDDLAAAVRLFEPKNAYGLTARETNQLVSIAAGSIRGYDIATEMAVIGYELDFDLFDELMAEHGVCKQ